MTFTFYCIISLVIQGLRSYLVNITVFITELVEALHQAAYRTGLGNSLYMAEHAVGRFSGEMLHSFVNNFFTSDNMAVVGIGVDHDHLVNLAKTHIAAGSSQSTIAPSKYHGGKD